MNAHLLTHTHISRMALYAAFLFIGVLCSVGNAWGVDSYTKITSTASLSNGDVVIIAMGSTSPTTGVTGGTVQNSTDTKKDATVSTTASEWMKFTVTTTTGGWYLKNSSNQYIGKPTDNTFYLTTGGDTYNGVCSVNSSGVLCCNSRYLQKNSSNYRMYNLNDNYSKFYVWKVTGGCTSISPTLSYSTDSIGIGGTATVASLNKDGSTGGVTYSVSPASGVATINASTGELTGTGTGNVTVTATIAAAGGKCEGTATATIKVRRGITYYVGATSYTVGGIDGNTLVSTLPASPSSCDAVNYPHFYGWKNGSISGSTTTAPTILSTETVSSSSAANTYYAVFTDGLTTEYTFTSSSWNATSGGADANWTSGKAGAGYTAGQGVQVTTTSTGANATSPISFSNVNKVVVTYNTNKTAGAGSIGIKIGSNSEVTNDVAYDSEISDDGRSANFTTEYTFSPVQTGTIKLTANTTTNSIWPKSIAIYSGAATPHYLTTCCSAPASALSITSANSVATGGTVTLTSTGGNGGTVTWSVVNGTGSATIEGTTLTAGSVGTVTVKAHQNATGGYCEQDAEQAFTIISATVNVTGVEVSPTSKAIVQGETFTITPTISPSNATDKSVSWTSSASDKASVSSGTVTGVAAGTATITCTTTDGSKTATTAVTVYGVTMQALDEDGNAIAVGGPGTPSRTGASISPAADAGNYVFKEWAISGASLGSSASTKANTITNPTGAVTVTAKYYKPRVVKWSVNGNDSYNTGGPTTTVAYNGTISTVPTDPSGLACASSFIAWTDATHNNGTTAKDDDSYYGSALYTDAGDFPSITAATTTFYAVFAEQDIYSGRVEVNTTNSGVSGGGYESTTFTVDEIEFAYNNWQLSTNIQAKASNSPSLNNNDAFPRRIDKIVVKQTGTARAVTISGKNFLNSAAAEAAGKTYESASITQPSTAATMTFTFPANKSYPFFELNTPGNAVYMDSVVIYYKEIITSNYVTQCDPNIVKVTYDANGGATTCLGGTHDKTTDYTVCATEPTRNYYNFAGWLCSADGATYNAGATIDDAAIDADFTLTAQWTPVPYDITYELDGGTNNVGNPATYNVTTATITLQDPTKGHDRFDGWYKTYSAGVYSDPVTSIPLGSHGDITLYAKWAERHEIIFDADGATTTIYRADDEDLSASVAEQGSVPSDPSAPTACSSKVFVGWSESTIDGETDTEPGDLMKPAAGTVDEDKHYYAVWAIESSESGTVYLYNGSFEQVANGTAYGNKGKWKTSTVFGTGTAGEVRMSSGSASGSMDLDLSDKTLATTITVTFKMKRYGTETGSVTLSCKDDGSTASFGSSPFSYPTGDDNWHDCSSTVTSVNNVKTNSIHFTSTSGKRVYVKDVVVSQIGTIYSYSAYSTSCCATKVTLSQNSPEHGTIAFGKTKVGTCGDQDVTLTITPAAGYQLHTYEVATGSGKVATKSVSPDIALDNNSSAVQNITLTFADEANGAYDVTASFTEMTVTSWTWTNHDGGAAVTTDPFEIYVGQSARVDVAYNPSSVLSSHKNYSRNKDDTYINWPGGVQPSAYCTFFGRASTGENTTTITLTHSDASLTQLVYVKVLPLPLTHFVDLVHGKSFDDVEATLETNVLSATKNTPTSDDWTTPNANTCEENHLHLVGWIREDWPALVAYLNGTGDAPTTEAITGAGNDGSGLAYYIAAGASIDVQTFDGVTFYAVWAKIE